MKIVQVSYGRTFNTGNYTSERIDLTATIDESEDHEAVKLALEAECCRLGFDRAGQVRAYARLAELEAAKA